MRNAQAQQGEFDPFRVIRIIFDYENACALQARLGILIVFHVNEHRQKTLTVSIQQKKVTH